MQTVTLRSSGLNCTKGYRVCLSGCKMGLFGGCQGGFGGCQGGFGGCQRDNGITARLLPNWRGQRFGPRQADPLPFFWPELSKSNTGVRRPKPAKSTDYYFCQSSF